ARSAGKAAVPAGLTQATVRLGLLVAAGWPAAGQIPAHVAALATGVTREMFLTKAKVVTALLLGAGLLLAGATLLSHKPLPAEGRASAAAPKVKPSQPAKPTQDGIEVAGRVLGPDGKPVAQARLFQASWPERPTQTRKPQAVARGVSDKEGRFRI